MPANKKINIDEPRWDQSTYWGRARYYFTTTNPLNLLVSDKRLDEAKEIVTKYRRKGDMGNLTEDELWRAKEIYDSAFHPDTGEKMMLIGRMSAQVPMNMTITGCMMTFYKSAPAVIFWQWVNQSFNAIVNYTNRSGGSPITNDQLAESYALATGGALITALGLNSLVKRAPPIVGRWVPFAAVAAANCINIPMMRLQELKEGIPVNDEKGKKLTMSKVAAQHGIGAVTISRISMAAPGMALTPVVMDYLEKRGTLCRYPWSNAPIQILLCGFFLTFATPMCCALFQQKASISVDQLEPEAQQVIKKKSPPPEIVYYNKGL
ncbi:sideroflexin-3 [Anabrus simplex]|uniref:sideroflexin-3 n=1 Tax=Anabrus simplex TaxID=316456 RepID=UPI0035A34B7B